MNNKPESSHTLSNLPMKIRLKIESVCVQFEEELRADNNPKIEEYLNENSKLPRGHLLRELLVQEIQYLSQTGFEPEIPSCLKRFPDDRKMVEHAFSIAAPLLSGSGLDSIPAESEVPKELRYFGEYELLREINRGGMGIVYLAKQKRLGRIVAIKTILSGLLASKDDIKRFETEARATALLDHPGIVPIHQIGEHEGKHFYSMAYVDGPSLAEVIKRGPIAPYRATEIIRKAAEAVQHAHDHSIIHRDIKPGNILLATNDTPRITDFGLAKIVQDANTSSTAQGIILGTAGYMSPEQASGMGKVTFSTDIYALGSTLYNLLTGRPPFAAADIVEVLRQVKEVEPASPRLLNPAIPEELEAIVMKCLHKDPRQRYRTAAELAGDLEKCFDDTVEPTQVSKPKPPQDQALSLVFDGNDDIAEIDDFYETPSRPVPPRRASRKEQPFRVKKKVKPKSGLAIATAIVLILQWIAMMIMMGFFITGMTENFRDSDVIFGMNIMAGITMIFSVPGVICFMMWLRDMWGHVDEREDRPTPTQAIMNLFIPFYNFYWIFRVIPGLSLALQEDFEFHHPEKETGSTGYGLGVFAAAGNFVPVLNFIAPLLLAIWVLKTNGAKNKLICAEQGIAIEKVTSPPSHKLRNVYAWGIVVCSSSAVLFSVIAYLVYFFSGHYKTDRWAQSQTYYFDHETYAILCFISAFFLLINAILFYLWLYQSWKILKPTENRPPPETIIWRLFIPLYNLYWIFRVIPGLSRALRDDNQDSSLNKNRYHYIFSTVLCGLSIGYMVLRPLFVQLKYEFGSSYYTGYDIDIVHALMIMGACVVLSPISSQLAPLFSIWMFLENREINKLTNPDK